MQPLIPDRNPTCCPAIPVQRSKQYIQGWKNRRALLAVNVKQLQEMCLNEDLLLNI
jgi:hypothetical protein